MMRKIIFLLLTVFSTTAMAQTAKDRTAILKVLENQRQGWNKGDMENYMQGYWKSDSLLFVGKNGPTYGWQKNFG